jgi:hypothetical protein
MGPWNTRNVPPLKTLIILGDDDFQKLINGEVVEKAGVKIALSDIGFLRMQEIIDKNYNKSLNETYPKQQKQYADVDFIEYTDNDDNYVEPERNCSDWVDMRLYCLYKGCKQYIKGKEGYNGLFVTENGKQADLRNQCWICKKHDHENETFVDFNGKK